VRHSYGIVIIVSYTEACGLQKKISVFPQHMQAQLLFKDSLCLSLLLFQKCVYIYERYWKLQMIECEAKFNCCCYKGIV
jgi:hypothetical protein